MVLTLVLTGIAVNAVAGAVISFLLFVADTSSREQIVFWQMGSLDGAIWTAVGGALLLSGADLVARTAIAYADLPIGIFTALVGGPVLFLLLDEPVSAMDIRHQEQTLKTCRRLAAEGAAVAVVLHDLDAAAAYADRLVLMHEGRIHAAGTVEEICRAETLSKVYGTPIEVFRTGLSGRLRVAPVR